MTIEDIIRMAREAGFSIDDLYPNASIKEIERFAILVASFTWREQALSEVQKVGQVIEEIQAAVLAEREACAKDLDDASEAAKDVDPQGFVWRAVKECAEAIRARGKQDGECKYCTDGCPACDARKLPEQEPVQVSPLEFVEMVMEKEHLVGKPIFWAEWPNKEKNT